MTVGAVDIRSRRGEREDWGGRGHEDCGGRVGVRRQQVTLHVALRVEYLLADGTGGLAAVNRTVAPQR